MEDETQKLKQLLPAPPSYFSKPMLINDDEILIAPSTETQRISDTRKENVYIV